MSTLRPDLTDSIRMLLESLFLLIAELTFASWIGANTPIVCTVTSPED